MSTGMVNTPAKAKSEDELEMMYLGEILERGLYDLSMEFQKKYGRLPSKDSFDEWSKRLTKAYLLNRLDGPRVLPKRRPPPGLY